MLTRKTAGVLVSGPHYSSACRTHVVGQFGVGEQWTKGLSCKARQGVSSHCCCCGSTAAVVAISCYCMVLPRQQLHPSAAAATAAHASPWQASGCLDWACGAMTTASCVCLCIEVMSSSLPCNTAATQLRLSGRYRSLHNTMLPQRVRMRGVLETRKLTCINQGNYDAVVQHVVSPDHPLSCVVGGCPGCHTRLAARSWPCTECPAGGLCCGWQPASPFPAQLFEGWYDDTSSQSLTSTANGKPAWPGWVQPQCAQSQEPVACMHAACTAGGPVSH
jgi:hypothetical protein